MDQHLNAIALIVERKLAIGLMRLETTLIISKVMYHDAGPATLSKDKNWLKKNH
jgi:hypothetical protein